MTEPDAEGQKSLSQVERFRKLEVLFLLIIVLVALGATFMIDVLPRLFGDAIAGHLMCVFAIFVPVCLIIWSTRLFIRAFRQSKSNAQFSAMREKRKNAD